MRTFRVLSIGLVAIVAAACSSSGSSATPVVSSPSAAAVVTTAPSVAPSATPSASPDACAAANLTLVAPGKLTIGTDNPAYPPYFAENADGHKTAPWELGDPTNGQGFESAVAYALADASSASPRTRWRGPTCPFDNSFKPGPEDVRLRHQPGLVHARAGPGGRPDRRLLLRQPGDRRAGRQPDRQGHDHRRPGGLHSSAPRSGRRATRPSPTSSSRPRTRASTTPTTRRSRPQGQADRRHRRRPADRVLHGRRPARQRHGRRPVHAADRERRR